MTSFASVLFHSCASLAAALALLNTSTLRCHSLKLHAASPHHETLGMQLLPAYQNEGAPPWRILCTRGAMLHIALHKPTPAAAARSLLQLLQQDVHVQ
jgi:hypothetical protein